jgi:tetratricopeptide (TPR) repeat protein
MKVLIWWLAATVVTLATLPGCNARTGNSPGGATVSTSAQTAAGAEMPAEATSLLGAPLRRPVFAEPARSRMEAQLDSALATARARPGDADALIWVGRRQAYLGRYRDAVTTFTRGVEQHPSDARMLRHRGHRFITLRQFDRAVSDFQEAVRLIAGTGDEVEPDGMPNPLGIPTSTLHFNIWYHLGLAHYLRGEFDQANEAYRRCMAVSNNPDAVVATLHWQYMTLRRLRRDDEARALLQLVTPDMRIIENDAYFRLALMYRGELPADSLWNAGVSGTLDNVTVGYGVANWHNYNGRGDLAERMFRQIVAQGQWAAFGHIAAEAELARR